MQKVPYLLVVGDREAENDAVSVRKRSEGDLGSKPVSEFIEMLEGEMGARGVEAVTQDQRAVFISRAFG